MRIHVDITDLLEFLIESDLLHGVQNVVFHLMAELRRQQRPAALIGYHPLYGRPFSADLALLPDAAAGEVAAFKRLFGIDGRRPVKSPAAIRDRHPGRPLRQNFEYLKRRWRLMQRRRATLPPPVRLRDSVDGLGIAAGDVVLLPGLNVWYRDHNSALGAATRRAAARLIPFMHDLGPLTAAAYFPPSYRRAYAAWLDGLLPWTDAFLAASQNTARELADILRQRQLDLPITVVPLAHEFRRGGGEPVRSDIGALAETPFVLAVGRIEPRKNIEGLIAAWKALAAELGDGMPLLVLAGRFNLGGGAPGLALPAQGGIRFVHDPNVTELARLYETCRFTVYPSFFEGWGLPVGEAAAFGKVTAASRAASIPEVVGDLAVYFDPADQAEMRAVLRRLIMEPEALAALEQRLRDCFRPRSWADTARTIVDAIDHRAAQS